MTKMEQFVKAMEVAFSLSRELGEDGISHIDWSITYCGTTSATAEIKQRMDEALIKAGCKVRNEGVA